MEEEKEIQQIYDTKRPFFLSVLCVSVLVYSFVFAFIMLLGVLFNIWLTTVANDYFTTVGFTKEEILIFCVVGFFLYAFSFISTIFIWRLKRIGLIIYIICSVLIAGLPILIGFGSYINALIISLLIILFLVFKRKINQ